MLTLAVDPYFSEIFKVTLVLLVCFFYSVMQSFIISDVLYLSPSWLQHIQLVLNLF